VSYKTEPAGALVRAIRKVQAGEAWLSRSLVTFGLAGLRAAASPTAIRDSDSTKIGSLTAREREVVALLSNGTNRKKIAEQLGLSETTIQQPRSFNLSMASLAMALASSSVSPSVSASRLR